MESHIETFSLEIKYHMLLECSCKIEDIVKEPLFISKIIPAKFREISGKLL